MAKDYGLFLREAYNRFKDMPLLCEPFKIHSYSKKYDRRSPDNRRWGYIPDDRCHFYRFYPLDHFRKDPHVVKEFTCPEIVPALSVIYYPKGADLDHGSKLIQEVFPFSDNITQKRVVQNLNFFPVWLGAPDYSPELDLTHSFSWRPHLVTDWSEMELYKHREEIWDNHRLQAFVKSTHNLY